MSAATCATVTGLPHPASTTVPYGPPIASARATATSETCTGSISCPPPPHNSSGSPGQRPARERGEELVHLRRAVRRAGELAGAVHVVGADDGDLLTQPRRAGQAEVFRARLRDRVRVRLPLVPGADLHHGDPVPGGRVVDVDRAEDVDLARPRRSEPSSSGVPRIPARLITAPMSPSASAQLSLDCGADVAVAASRTGPARGRGASAPRTGAADEPGRPGDQDLHATSR